jgi:hypothetical protein
MSQNEHLKFSMTVHTDDRKLIGCLSALAHVSQPENRRQIHIEGQVGGNWERNGHQAIFHFSSAEIRQEFIKTAQLLYGHGWKVKEQRDNDPPYDSN